jgi:hypothetical protein
LLQQDIDSIVIDQPEDHLDNAFVATTVVAALRSASAARQVIVTTHNANIPVLADADLVVHIGSDGRRGFVRSAEPLDHPLSKEAITTVMEGGQRAFDTRARFYRRSGG